MIFLSSLLPRYHWSKPYSQWSFFSHLWDSHSLQATRQAEEPEHPFQVTQSALPSSRQLDLECLSAGFTIYINWGWEIPCPSCQFQGLPEAWRCLFPKPRTLAGCHASSPLRASCSPSHPPLASCANIECLNLRRIYFPFWNRGTETADPWSCSAASFTCLKTL